jgi:hypothetical protein
MSIILTQSERFDTTTKINKTKCAGCIAGHMISLSSFANIDPLFRNILSMSMNFL